MAKRKFNPFGRFFDFKRNGKTEPWELWIATQILQDSIQDDTEIQTDNVDDIYFEDEDSYISFLKQCDNTDPALSDRYEWRQQCPDGSEYDISPEDFETEHDYLEALEEAKYEWREYCDDGTEYGISPEDYETEEEYTDALIDAEDAALNLVIRPVFSVEYDPEDADQSFQIKESDYPNRRTYLAACELASAREDGNNNIIKQCSFVLDNPNLIAAKYYSVGHGFLYAQAIKENFEIPSDFPDEDEWSKTNFFDIIKRISEISVPLSLEIWKWCVDHFMPYLEYTDGFDEKLLTCTIIDHIYEMPDEFSSELISYLNENPEFSKKIISHAPEISQTTHVLLHQAILKYNFQAATRIFTDMLNNKQEDIDTIIKVTDILIYCCRTWKDTEAIQAFKEYLLPILKMQDNPQYVEYTARLENEITSYCHAVEQQLQEKNDTANKNSQLDTLAGSMEDLINCIEQGNVWGAFDSNTPEFITYEFTYPNGKNGDIDMFIASNYGQVDKLDELHYSAVLPTAHKEKLVLLVYIYVLRGLNGNQSPRNEIEQFLYDYNLGHRLRQYCDDYIVLGGDTLRFNETDEECIHWLKVRYGSASEEEISKRLHYAKIRRNAIAVANQYMDTVRQDRNNVYAEIVKQGLASARWTSE